MITRSSSLALIGGTGPEGFGLSVRWCLAGESVAIGSRSAARAAEAVLRIGAMVPGASVTGGENDTVVRDADAVVVAVPLSALESTLAPLTDLLSGKLVISVVAALDWVDGRPRPARLAEGSAAQRIQALLPHSRVTSGFHTLSADKLGDPSQYLDEDCIICGDDRDARRATMELAGKIEGIRPLSCGRLENSVYPELLVGMLATINRIHKVQAGIRLVGIGHD